MMKYKTQLTALVGITILAASLMISGCSESSDEMKPAQTPKVNSEIKADALEAKSDNFRSHATGAKEFLRLYNKGKQLRAEGNYQEALDVFENAYNNASFGRSEQTMLLHQSAITYKEMGSFELSANFYEGAAKTTMNPEQAKEFNGKALALREQHKNQ